MAPKRTSGPAADVLRKLMKSQQDALNKAFDDATLYSHPGLKGGKREEGVSTFLAGQLPQSLKVVTGQAIDYRGSVSSQLDIMVYDANLNAPLHGEGQAKLLPAEALLAIVEVKTVVTLQEWDKVSRSVAKYLELMPYKNSFGTRRSGQKAVSDNLPRCFYSIVAFSSDLVKSPDWPQRELARMRNAFGNENCLGLDRVLILDRGVINPAGSRSLSNDDLGNNLFAWYVSMANFLNREAPRRKPMDWQHYAGASFDSWQRIPSRAGQVRVREVSTGRARRRYRRNAQEADTPSDDAQQPS